MKMLAIEKPVSGVKWENANDLLNNEARRVFELYLSDTLREIYFTENKNAVLVLESEDKSTAKIILDTLPLVESGKIEFELMELKPYNGYERIMRCGNP